MALAFRPPTCAMAGTGAAGAQPWVPLVCGTLCRSDQCSYFLIQGWTSVLSTLVSSEWQYLFLNSTSCCGVLGQGEIPFVLVNVYLPPETFPFWETFLWNYLHTGFSASWNVYSAV